MTASPTEARTPNWMNSVIHPPRFALCRGPLGCQVRRLDLVDALDEVRAGAFEDDLTTDHDAPTVGDRQRLVDELLDDKDARSARCGGLQCREQTFDDEWGETKRQFVNDQHSWSAGQRTSDGQHLLFASR